MRRELSGERFQELAERVGLGQGGGGRVGQGGVGGGLGEAFGVHEQRASGVVGSDHPRVRRRVPGPGADLDERVEVGGGQPGGIWARRVEHGVQPGGIGAMSLWVGRGRRAHGREEGAVSVVVELAPVQVADVGEPVRVQEECAEQGLLGVVHRPGRR